MNQVWLNITENHHTHYGQNNYMQQVNQVPNLCHIRNLTLVKSTQDKNMTSSQTSRGSAAKNYSTYPLIPPAMQLGEQLHPCYFFFFWGGGGLMHPSPTTKNQAPTKLFMHQTAVSCFLDSILTRYILQVLCRGFFTLVQ